MSYERSGWPSVVGETICPPREERVAGGLVAGVVQQAELVARSLCGTGGGVVGVLPPLKVRQGVSRLISVCGRGCAWAPIPR